MSYIYLASPYTHQYKCVEEERFKEVCRATATLMLKGVHIFSPIAHTHPIAKMGDLPTHFGYWAEYDKVMLRNARALWILCLPGWELSSGILGEVKLAEEYQIEIRYLHPGTYNFLEDFRRLGDGNKK